MKQIIHKYNWLLIVGLVAGIIFGLFFLAGAALATDALDNYGLDAASGFGLGSRGLVETIGNIVKIFLGFLGILAVLLIAYGGFLWMTAAGDPDKVIKAKKVIIAAVIGLVIIFSAFAIASFVINQISNATNANPPSPAGPKPPTPWNWSSQYSYIGGFKDDSVGDDGWVVNVGWNYTGTLGIPASATLHAKGYAKNSGSVINAMDFYSRLASETNFSPVSAFAISADQEVVSNVYAPWNTSASNIGDQFLARITVTAPGDSFQSNVLNTKIKPIHCFNGVQDASQGETGVDCGGECGACAGDPCDADTDTPICDADNAMCATGVCDIGGGCVCARVPEIIYISPADDPNKDTNYDEPATWNDDIPNGAPGNYITIWGRYFGNEPGEIRFNDTVANLSLKSGCDDTWTYYQIIVEVPNLPQGDYNVQVFNDSGLGSNTKTFSINNIERPGICSAYNLTKFEASGIKINSGKAGDEVVSVGNNYPLNDAAGDFFWYFSTKEFNADTDSWNTVLLEHNNNTTVWNWDREENLKDYVPTNRKGRSSSRVYNISNSQYSNYYKFLVSPGELGDPCGYDTALCARDTNTCQEGLVCDNDSCTCQLAPNICGDGILGPEEACDIVSNSYAFYDSRVLCQDYDLGEGQVGCTSDCQLDTSACELSGELASPASQSIYTWAFITGDDDGPEAYAIEDCTRSRSCTEGAKLPSPTPWSEGWNTENYPYYQINNPLACLDVVISARFNTQMDPATINSENIKVLKCDNIEGENCVEVGGTLSLASDNSDKESDYFRFISTEDLQPKSWYKVVLRQGITTETGKGFRINESDRAKINKRFCNVNDINNGSYSISDPVYCWNFQTREDNNCKPGCVECSPDPHTMYWPGALTGYLADVDSEDNVCLLLDPQKYNWEWFTDKSDKLSVAPANAAATAKALGETIYDRPNPYASLFAKMIGYDNKEDYCRAYNDFTNPIVVEDASCSNGNIQSPTPWKESQDACVNAMIAARFSRNMLDSSVSADNIKVQQCNSGVNDKFDLTSCSDISYHDLRIFDYSHETLEVITQEDIIMGDNNSSDNLAEGFVITPFDNNDEFASNTWYRVIIVGGENGVKGAKLDGGEERAEGKLEKPNCDGNNDNVFDDYCWKFKTGQKKCVINSVNVAPKNLFMRYTDSNQTYNAFPQASNCNLLNPDSYNWNWRSLIALTDDTAENNPDGGSGIKVASICKSDVSQCLPSDYLASLSDSEIKAFAQAEGVTNIKARAENTREVDCAWDNPSCGDKWNYGNLRIGFANLQIVNYKPRDTRCSDAPIELAFNIDVEMATVKPNDNIILYQLNNSNGLSRINLKEGVYPDFDYSTTVKVQPVKPLTTGNYRVVVKGGPKEAKGIIAWNGKELKTLNYNSSPNKVGEECESSLYPWSEKSGVCSARCLLTGNLCGTQFAECDTPNENYCTSECHNAGNENKVSCGNGVIEAGEACDDGNMVSGDGCSLNCLREGSNQRWGSLCGNGVIEAGEACDDGNMVSGDGCSSNCLWEGSNEELCGNGDINVGEECDYGSNEKNIVNGCDLTTCLFVGSQPGVPMCGNGVIEMGEDCDDSNTNSGDGCDNKCNNEGSGGCSDGRSTGCCGNEFVESTAPDSFSWEFSVDQSESICYPGAKIDINPCPNAIWRVTFPQGIGNAKVVIQQGSAENSDPENCVAASESLSFWQQGLKKIKNTIKRAFGLTVSAANYWCTISEENYNFSDFNNLAIESGRTEKFEIIGYRDNYQSAVVNYLKDNSWTLGGEYRIVVDYDNYGLSRQVIEKSLTVFNTASGKLNENNNCALTGQIVNIWPIGEAKDQDNFFCDADNCGQNDYDPYLKDQDSSQDGNNHLYRAWAINNVIEPGRNYLVKPKSGFEWLLSDIIPTNKLNIKNTEYDDTNYNGDQWLTLTKSDLDIYEASGLANLLVKAIESLTNFDDKNININVFLCDNPWPYPQFFPFMDSETNCPLGSPCLNTNFKTYYCRDSGNKEPFDDLPAIGNYDYLTKKLDITISGLNKDIIKDFFFNRSLPDRIKDDFRYWDGEVNSTSNIVFEEGKVGQALWFNSTAGQVAIEIEDFWNEFKAGLTASTIPVTISAWVKPGTKNEGSFFGDDSNEGYVKYNRGDNSFEFKFIGTTKSFSVASDKFNDWHFVAISFSGSSGNEVKFYLDDQEETIIGSSDNLAGDLFIGYNSNGLIDELKIYQATLSKEEIIGNSGRNLFAYYSFDEPSNDAIGLRVARNDEHFSPSLWYFSNFDRDRQGKPKLTTIDGYQAAQEGRTTYVNAADLNNDLSKIFTDIYLISYNEGADKITQNIYSLMLKYLGFNYGEKGESDGGLMDSGQCSGNSAVNCRTDRDCQLENFGYCDSNKAKLTRDTRRLADAQDINLLLEAYRSIQRCNNDHSVLCSNSSQCYGDGVCGGYYPVLKSGSYIVGRSLSVWPSWQATLGNFLGMALPVDPLNNLAGCSNPYNSITCWDENAKSMQCPTSANVYYYYDKNQTDSYAGIKTFNEYSNNWDNDGGLFEATLNLFNFIPNCP